MTNDEKAKAYDMALEAARKELGVDRKEWEVVQRVLHNIFPELRESEDEKAKKIIASVFSEAGYRYIQKSERDIVLAWLEKQKELMPPVNVDPCDASCDAYYQRGLNKGYELGLEAGRKEQKPAEKKDYSGLNDLERAIHRGFLCAGVENVPVTIIKDTAAECMGFLALIEPKPAWSEEDEFFRQQLIVYCEKGIQDPLAAKCVDWLKSLHPSWKPSEEQMDALQHAIDACESEWAYQDDELRSLLNDIKKL